MALVDREKMTDATGAVHLYRPAARPAAPDAPPTSPPDAAPQPRGSASPPPLPCP